MAIFSVRFLWQACTQVGGVSLLSPWRLKPRAPTEYYAIRSMRNFNVERMAKRGGLFLYKCTYGHTHNCDHGPFPSRKQVKIEAHGREKLSSTVLSAV